MVIYIYLRRIKKERCTDRNTKAASPKLLSFARGRRSMLGSYRGTHIQMCTRTYVMAGHGVFAHAPIQDNSTADVRNCVCTTYAKLAEYVFDSALGISIGKGIMTSSPGLYINVKCVGGSRDSITSNHQKIPYFYLLSQTISTLLLSNMSFIS
jgi:hypothetical protein